jgi:hypothetical protein
MGSDYADFRRFLFLDCAAYAEIRGNLRNQLVSFSDANRT